MQHIRLIDIEAISAGYAQTVAIKKGGKAIATGDNQYGQCNVEDCNDLIAISAGFYHTLGLKSDGTVLATGDNDAQQCETDS